MRALTLAHTGEPEQMSITEIPTPEPGPGQLRLSVTACGLNPTDYQRARHGVPDWQWPAVLGLDPAGVVDAVGEGVEGFAVGDRVVAVGDIRERGGFAEHTVVDVDAAARIPDEVSDVAAAAIPSGGLTAWDAVVEKLRVGPEDLVVITGASGGIGKDFAVTLASRGADVILVARSADKLAALADELHRKHKVRAEVITADLSVPGAADRVVAGVDYLGLTVDVLINNAGFGTYGDLVDTDPARIRQEVALNVGALTDFTTVYIKRMAEAGTGAIVNIASNAAFQPVPSMAVYAATKAYVLSLSEALWSEGKRKGVHVLAVCPGATDTEFFDVAGDGSAMKSRRTTEQVERAFVEDREHTFLYSDAEGFHFMNPESYEQVAVPEDVVGDAAPYLQEGMAVMLSIHNDTPLTIELPQRVTLEVVETEPVTKGQTASSSYKPAVLDNGVRIMIPPYMSAGEKIVVDTTTGEYVRRAD